MTFRQLNGDLALSLVWLTRFPVAMTGGSKRRLADAAWAFPLVGLIVGGVGAAILMLGNWTGAPYLLTAVLAVSAMILATGALHEDGLADFADGLGARGGATEKLAAMRDSHIGTYGVLALIVSFAVRVTALAGLSEALVLVAACVISRALMVRVMQALPFARPDGAASAAGQPDMATVWRAGAMALLLTVLLALVGGFGLLETGLAVVSAVGAGLYVSRMAVRTLGGVTGDVLGAICLVSETVMLVVLAIMLG